MLHCWVQLTSTVNRNTCLTLQQSFSLLFPQTQLRWLCPTLLLFISYVMRMHNVSHPPTPPHTHRQTVENTLWPCGASDACGEHRSDSQAFCLGGLPTPPQPPPRPPVERKSAGDTRGNAGDLNLEAVTSTPGWNVRHSPACVAPARTCCALQECRAGHLELLQPPALLPMQFQPLPPCGATLCVWKNYAPKWSLVKPNSPQSKQLLARDCGSSSC